MKKMIVFLLLLLTSAVFAQTVSLQGKGNNGTEGGLWIPLNNDYRKLPSGKHKFGGLEFDIAIGPKACILVGGEETGFPPAWKVEFDQPVSGQYLYLLNSFIHLPSPKIDERNCGNLRLYYTDGSTSDVKMTRYKDVGYWKGDTRKVGNAIPVWSLYNLSGISDAYVSRIPLKGELKSIEFLKGNRYSSWAVFGLNADQEQRILPLSKVSLLTRDFPVAKRFTDKELAELPTEGTPKNVIFIIGDGMGMGALQYASTYAYGEQGKLLMEQLPVKGLVETYSANADVTDSAAGGTALACGIKTNNGYVGVNPAGEKIRSIAEACRDAGKSVGILTDDSLYGATPGAYSAHVAGRSAKTAIADQQLESGFEVLIGGEEYTLPIDGIDVKAADKDYTFVRNMKDFFNAEGKTFGTIPLDDNLDLAKVTRVMLRRLNANPKGFFAMIETYRPDNGGHYNNPDFTVFGVTAVDHVLRAAVEFARENPETLIVVTADHETGGIACTRPIPGQKAPIFYCLYSDHSGAPVGIFAAGPGSKVFGTVQNNIDVAKAIFRMLGLEQGVKLP